MSSIQNSHSSISIDYSGMTQSTASEDMKEDICLSDLYSLLQTSISTVESSPHNSIDTLTLLMEKICSQQEQLQKACPLNERMEFWKQLNGTWLFVIESAFKSKRLKFEDWKVVGETIVAAGDVLSLYGLVDYPLGLEEAKIIEAICSHLPELKE